MHNVFSAIGLFFILSCAVFAQADDEFNKNEFYVGYSNQQLATNNERESANGFEVGYTRNLNRYFGVKVSFSGAYKNDQISATDPVGGDFTFRLDSKRSIHNLLGGIQVKDNDPDTKVKPFAHALVGVARNRFTSDNFTCTSGNCPPVGFPDFEVTDNGFAGAFGGGLDIRLNRRIDLRVIQVDFNPTYSNNRSDNNIRIGVGIVFK
jgi:opacity protein-like surface antigen